MTPRLLGQFWLLCFRKHLVQYVHLIQIHIWLSEVYFFHLKAFWWGRTFPFTSFITPSLSSRTRLTHACYPSASYKYLCLAPLSPNPSRNQGHVDRMVKESQSMLKGKEQRNELVLFDEKKMWEPWELTSNI